MPGNRLCQIFDRKLKSSKSTSNLLCVTSRSDVLSQQPRSKSRESLSILVDYNFDKHPHVPTYPSSPPPPPTTRAVNPHRASSTPMIHPPDELFLRMVRRRSANARLEHRIQGEPDSPDSCQKDGVPTAVAVAYALPPQYFDLPPAYESPQQAPRIWSPPPIRTRATIVKPRGAELFLEDDLHAQIDQAIAEFGGFRLIEASPVHASTPEIDNPLVSPINEIDTIYLERRKERKRHQQLQQLQQQQHVYLTIT